MGRIYAVEEDTGQRHLVRIECDHIGCLAKMKPGDAHVMQWTKKGWDNGLGTDKFENYYCPEHA